MSPNQTRELWRELEVTVSAAGWILQHADCQGPLSHLPTADPAVRVLMSARRRLLKRAADLRRKLGVF